MIASLVTKRGSRARLAPVLSEDKYAPGETSRWKHTSARFHAPYKTLLDEPDETVRRSMFKTAVSRSG